MTEKRFYVDKSGDFRDTKTGDIIVDFGYSFNGMECKMILDLLNELNDEDEQLKNEIEKLSYANEDLLEEKRIWKQMSDEYTKLSYENEQLNLLSNLRGEMVSFATSLIQDMGSEEMLKMWNDFKEVMYQKWSCKND